MKITFTPFRAAKKIKSGIHTIHFFYGVSLTCLFLLSIVTSGLTAQANASIAPSDPISTEDLSIVKWKSPVEYDAVLTSERAGMALKLADPDLKIHLHALYSGYDRMLSYMQADRAQSMTLGEIAFDNYKKVLAETPGDDILKNMHTEDFDALYDILVTKLTQP